MKLTRILSLLVALVAPVSVFAASGGTAIPGGDVSTTYVITQTGYYYLSGNRTMTDITKPAIEIKANDVTIDLNGYNLRNKPGNEGIKPLIMIAETDNIEVRNGSLTDSAYAGILAMDSDLGGRLLARNVRFVGMKTGVNASKLNGVIIEDCSFDAIGQTAVNASALGGELIVRNCTITGYTAISCNNSNFRISNNVLNVAAAVLRVEGASQGRFENNKATSSVEAGVHNACVYLLSGFGSVDIIGNDFRMPKGGMAIGTGDFGASLSLVEGNTFRGGTAISTQSSKGLFLNNRLKTGTLIAVPSGALPASNLFF